MRSPILRDSQMYHGTATRRQWLHKPRSKKFMTLVLMAFMLVCLCFILAVNAANELYIIGGTFIILWLASRWFCGKLDAKCHCDNSEQGRNCKACIETGIKP